MNLIMDSIISIKSWFIIVLQYLLHHSDNDKQQPRDINKE